MNAFYNQTSALDLTSIKMSQSFLKDKFSNVKPGDCFLRVTKKGDGEVCLKIGKRTAINMADHKGTESKVLKFKEASKVIPLDTKIIVGLAELSQAGKEEAARKNLLDNPAEFRAALRRPAAMEKQPKPLHAILERIANGMNAPVARSL